MTSSENPTVKPFLSAGPGTTWSESCSRCVIRQNRLA
jgi:hypothetical protein